MTLDRECARRYKEIGFQDFLRDPRQWTRNKIIFADNTNKTITRLKDGFNKAITRYQTIPYQYAPRLDYSVLVPFQSLIAGGLIGYSLEKQRQAGADNHGMETLFSALVPVGLAVWEGKFLRKKQHPVTKIVAPTFNCVTSILSFQFGSGVGKVMASAM